MRNHSRRQSRPKRLSSGHGFSRTAPQNQPASAAEQGLLFEVFTCVLLRHKYRCVIMHRHSVWPQRRPRREGRAHARCEEQAQSPTARLLFSTHAKTPARISNRNTSEFRISPNPHKTQRITISNRNNNPRVAINSSSQTRDLIPLESSVISTTARRTSNRQFARLENALNPLKTWARHDF
jgi:hypothetical protein